MFTLHYMIPFLVGGTVCAHVGLLHLRGSGNCASVPTAGTEAEAFVVYYYKDLLMLCYQYSMHARIPC